MHPWDQLQSTLHFAVLLNSGIAGVLVGRRLAEGVSFSVLQIKSCHRVGGSRDGADLEDVMRRYVGNKAVSARQVEAEWQSGSQIQSVQK